MIAIVSLLISLIISRDWADAAGIFLGATLAILNFIFLTKIVVKFFDSGYKRKPILPLLFLLKLLLVAAILALSFWVLKLRILSFAWGYFSLVLAMIVVPLLTKSAGDGHGSDR